MTHTLGSCKCKQGMWTEKRGRVISRRGERGKNRFRKQGEEPELGERRRTRLSSTQRAGERETGCGSAGCEEEPVRPLAPRRQEARASPRSHRSRTQQGHRPRGAGALALAGRVGQGRMGGCFGMRPPCPHCSHPSLSEQHPCGSSGPQGVIVPCAGWVPGPRVARCVVQLEKWTRVSQKALSLSLGYSGGLLSDFRQPREKPQNHPFCDFVPNGGFMCTHTGHSSYSLEVEGEDLQPRPPRASYPDRTPQEWSTPRRVPPWKPCGLPCPAPDLCLC